MTGVFEYEVELKLTDRRTKVSEIRTFTVHAYQIADVLHQLTYTVLSEAQNPDTIDMRVLRLGPPARLIALATQDLELRVERAVAQIGDLLMGARQSS